MAPLGRILAIALALPSLAACARSSVVIAGREDGGSDSEAELCNGLDDDRDGSIDEDFRDGDGRYVHAAHCGACGRACDAQIANATEVACTLTEGLPLCAATRCATGFGTTRAGSCAALDDRLCLPCLDDGDCGALGSARCIELAGERRCTRACAGGCPEGYVCSGGDHCIPAAGSCRCRDSVVDFSVACLLSEASGGCPGSARCERGEQSACRAPAESCDGVDNDCDLSVDETFVDALGSYSLDLRHCGACGGDCSVDDDAGVTLSCGGDPFVPSCVTACPDLADGVQRGDRLDADRELANGCECVVGSVLDSAGASVEGEAIDANCDGADGSVLSSFYVASSGDDAGPGSPTRPLRSIGVAVERAFASLRTRMPRPHVYVASGIYTETVRVRDGVQVHGGYRGDFLARNPDGFEVVVVAPAETSAFGGAALVIDGPIRLPTLVEGLHLRGRDALEPGAPAIGAVVSGASARLTLRDLRVRAGRPGAGLNGVDGAAGQPPSTAAGSGQPPRAAVENGSHLCLGDDGNRVTGGRGGRNVCLGVDVSGGVGGSPVCPIQGGTAAAGQTGRGGDGLAGEGGLGGDDVTGPIQGGASCPSGVCCGLADFSVPNPFQQTQPGASGSDGPPGELGGGCSVALGRFTDLGFIAGVAGDGSSGAPGRGGGGGGGGGGARMTWFDGACEFADGLGGGGGGGGAGGCGGAGGTAGQSGGASVAILIRATASAELPLIEGVEITSADGARGGDGGSGGDGASGGPGGFGGNIPDALRATPTLAGPMAGERGGKGGDGGGGGGGGGGCGGSTVGIWVSGFGSSSAAIERMRDANTFVLGAAGPAGRGGSGYLPASDGAAGVRVDMVLQ